jgi:hypothetical protein
MVVLVLFVTLWRAFGFGLVGFNVEDSGAARNDLRCLWREARASFCPELIASSRINSLNSLSLFFCSGSLCGFDPW